MRKLFAISFFVILTLSLLASDIQTPNLNPVNLDNLHNYRAETTLRNAPAIEFEIAPVTIASGMYYDYCPGAYNSPPIRKQPEFSAPSNFPANGYYHTFMYQETAGSERRVFYTYITNDGVVSTPAAIGSSNIREGFPSMAIDPTTGNPFAVWHSNIDADAKLEGVLAFDLFNVVGSAGLWSTPFAVIDNPIAEFDPYADFNWPVVNIGPSPVEGRNRIHVYANNSPDTGTAEYNSIYGYSDFYFNEATFSMEFDGWNFQTFPVFDQWQDDQVKRAIKEIAVSETDGKVAFVGHAGDSLFCLMSNDYGTTFDTGMYNAHWDTWNPQNQDGSYYFMNDDGVTPAVLFTEPNGDGGHYNARFVDDSEKIIFMSAMGLNTMEGMANSTYLPAFFEPKIFIYDTVADDYSFVDLQVTGLDAYDNTPMIAWDLDEDGVVDEYYDDGTVYFADVWPTFFYAGEAQDGAFHYSNFKISSNENWAVALFQDGRNARQAYLENVEYTEWFETPEIAICVSADYGMTWSEPAYMNALSTDENYYSELDGMLPEFVYSTGGIEVIDDYHGKLPIVFLDDNSYGSYNPNTHGQPNGGTQMFAALNIEFPEMFGFSSSDPSEVPAIGTLSQNYPNPFNPNTTISFNLKEASNVSIDIYNIHGQKIDTVANGYYGVGANNVSWDGIDGEGRPVASGVYFYKMKAGRYTSTKKMILMK